MLYKQCYSAIYRTLANVRVNQHLSNHSASFVLDGLATLDTGRSVSITSAAVSRAYLALNRGHSSSTVTMNAEQ